MIGLLSYAYAYAYAYDDPYVAGLTSFLCFAFCFAVILMLMLSCEPGFIVGPPANFPGILPYSD